ncbi:MAG: ATP-binding protein [Candidatus Cloacimonetes bacterium]|nr:HAMP domain-containing protein [Candidatus Cloacimonadota bacterium]MDY0336582.1 ATP-binding protein [Candidatus Cloacimonadaceae bacterium]MCB5270119.1 HAMP domain-containing protein [Candidatus Cloacimonadota bacterium]MDD2543173.1 ATP-binding protein [Candidatus Cloacimonadota bacterium]MDD2682817.1 ATP-binding protein [Candidatus Cloacimonadota bacterium]
MKQKSILPLLGLMFSAVALIAFVIARMNLALYLSLLIIFVMGLIFAWLLLHYIRRPIHNLMHVADQIASKDLSARMPVNQGWEIARLAEFSNYMLDRMAASIERFKESRDGLKLILSSIEDALWVQDLSGRIELFNPVFAHLFPLADAQQPYCWEVIQDSDLLSRIKEISDQEKARLSEITINEHNYLLSASLNREAEKIIFILQNIDSIKAAEKMKRDFALNVAHELRTPLTAIKGFVDVVREDLPNNRYLDIIHKHTQRMIALVADLEELARLERVPQLDIQDICLKTFFANILSIYETTLKEKGLDLKLRLDPPDLRALFDPYRMEQVIVNLIDNAIRYTMSGGIEISAYHENTNLVLSVADSGKGIPQALIPRVFERFFTVDQSRSRQTGGTGLGLAIVKHIVVSHGGSIKLESELGIGSKFWIYLPQTR